MASGSPPVVNIKTAFRMPMRMALHGQRESALEQRYVQVSKIENRNDRYPNAQLHLEVPNDGNRQGSETDVGEDVAG
jgi:hypothetical protein